MEIIMKETIETSKCKYGYFNLLNHKYVITLPFTQKAWINYLGGVSDLNAFIFNCADGIIWYNRPLTGISNNISTK